MVGIHRVFFVFSLFFASVALPTPNAMSSESRVGFIGCGTIASAIATGIATHANVPSVAVSRRSEAKSSALKQSFPDLVTVHDENQRVVDESDLVFVCVLPEQADSVLENLKFDRERHRLISLMVRKWPHLILLY